MKKLVLALVLASIPTAARAKPHCAVPAAAADAFKEVTGAKADTAQSIDAPDGSLVIGTWTAGKRHRVTAAYVIAKGVDRCVGPVSAKCATSTRSSEAPATITASGHSLRLPISREVTTAVDQQRALRAEALRPRETRASCEF